MIGSILLFSYSRDGATGHAIEQGHHPTKGFEFIVNLKTAKQIGLTIPPNVLAARTE